MRKINHCEVWKLPKSRKTEFSREELLDILDFYLQYKPVFDESLINDENYSPILAANDFTTLLYMYEIIDLNYFENLDKIREKYGKKCIHDLSQEKLDFLEIITIFTFIHRADHHAGGEYEYRIKDNTYYNLLCRLETIENELKNGISN